MSFILLCLAIAFLWLAFKGAANIEAAFSVLQNSIFGGTSPFWKWEGSLIILYFIGQVPYLETPAKAFMVLVIVAIVLAHNGAWAKLVGEA